MILRKKIYGFFLLMIGTVLAQEHAVLTDAIDEYTDAIINHLPFLRPQEITLLEKFLYYSLTICNAEQKIRTALNNIRLLTLNEAQAPDELINNIIKIEFFLQKISIFLPLKLHSDREWKACMDTIHDSNYPILQDILRDIQSEGYTIIKSYIKFQDPHCVNIMQKNENIIRDVFEQITAPYEQTVHDEDMKLFIQGSKQAEILLHCTQQMTLSTMEMKEIDQSIIAISELLFISLYKKFYLKLYHTDPQLPELMDETYGPIMFNENKNEVLF